MSTADERKVSPIKVRVAKPASPRVASQKAVQTSKPAVKILATPQAQRHARANPKHFQPVTATSLLGLGRGVHGGKLSQSEWVSVIRYGVHADAINEVLAFLSLSKAELSQAIDIPLHALMHRKGKDVLSRDATAKLVRVARLIERAQEVLEDRNAAREWLKSANPALDGGTPMSMLDTEFGAEVVLDTLGRIEHGVYA